jgi:WD40 repeat protein
VSIDLETDSLLLENGNILVKTKKYGKIRVSWDALGWEEIWLTPSQKKQFYVFRNLPVPSTSGERGLVHKSFVYDVAFSRDGLTVATGGEVINGIKFWDSATGKLKGRIIPKKTVVGLSYNPDGKTLASGQSGEAPVRIWDIGKQIEIASFSEGDFGNVHPSIQCITYSPNGDLLAVKGPDDVIYIWDMIQRILLYTLIGHPSTLTALVFSPDGKILASSSCGPGQTIYDPGVIKLWDLTSGIQMYDLKGVTGYIDDLAFSPDGKTLISAGYTKYEKGEVLFWNIETGQLLGKLLGTPENVSSMILSADGCLLAFDGNDGMVRVWTISPTTYQSISTLCELKCSVGSLKPEVFSPNGKMLATTSDDATVRIYDLPQNDVE